MQRAIPALASALVLGILLTASLATEEKGKPGVKPSKPKLAVPTYFKDVAPIFQKRCQNCHRPKAIGPFSLLTYKQAAGNSAMIGEVVKNRRMPPWHADPKINHFSNSRRLPESERKVILDWVQGGAPAGDKKHAPPPIKWPDPEGWRIGKPDAVLSGRAFDVPESGVIEYQYAKIKTDFGEDKWVRSVEVKVGAPEVVHHVLVFIRYPNRRGTPRVRGGLEGYFASALPGDTIRPFPEGAGKFIPRGATLVFQIHYTPDGTKRTDLTRIGFKFAKKGEKITRRVRTVSLHTVRFLIPPRTDDVRVRASHAFRRDTVVVGLTPHMHLRGKSFRYTLRYPDGTEKALLNVPKYDFNWQNTYRFTKPLFVPRGSRMLGVATYDNSKNNPANPNPNAIVRFGEQTWHEMMIGYIDTIDPSPADRKAYEATQKKFTKEEKAKILERLKARRKAALAEKKRAKPKQGGTGTDF